jgi:tRNA (mo5U34)-methyltransferase
VEERALPLARRRAELVHHIGVLYHLSGPVSHLLDRGALAESGLMPDTRHAAPAEADGVYDVQGRRFRCGRFSESGRRDPFSGVCARSKWPLLDDTAALSRDTGFSEVEIAEQRAERNGPRALIFASKPG